MAGLRAGVTLMGVECGLAARKLSRAAYFQHENVQLLFIEEIQSTNRMYVII
jgi:hypothetical protein